MRNIDSKVVLFPGPDWYEQDVYGEHDFMLPCQQSFGESVNELILEIVHVKPTRKIGTPTTLNIPISEGCTNSSHMHIVVNSQSYRRLKLLLSNSKFLTMVFLCLFTIDLKKINVCHMIVCEQSQVPRLQCFLDLLVALIDTVKEFNITFIFVVVLNILVLNFPLL